MKCIILAAGYATRLYPLTKNFPKPLLMVGEKTILDWLIDDMEKGKRIDEYIVISNHRFIEHFNEWAKDRDKITVIDDLTTDNENRLGAVRDILYAVEKCNVKDDTIVLAGDNVLDFSLNGFIDYFNEKQKSVVMSYYEEDKSKISKSGMLVLDDENKVLKMVEKPKEPVSNYCCPPFYIYKKEDLSLLGECINSGCNADAPGSFVSWLCERRTVYAYTMNGKRYDIGNLESYERVKSEYKGID